MNVAQPATPTTKPLPTHHPTSTLPPPPITPGGTHEGMDTQYTHHGPKGERWGLWRHRMRSPQGGGLSARKGRLKVVVCPCRGSDLTSAHPGPQKAPPLGRGPPPPVWGVHLDAPGQWGGRVPFPVWVPHRAVKQGQSGGSVGTTYEGKGRVTKKVRLGQAGRERAQGGERLMGAAASGGTDRQQYNQGSPPPPHAAGIMIQNYTERPPIIPDAPSPSI